MTATLPPVPPQALDRPALLTVEEARATLIRSALVCLRHAGGAPRHLPALLAGHPGSGNPDHERLAVAHRQTLDMVARAGHGWIIDDQVAGIVAAVGLDDGEVRDLDVIAAQLPD